ncbi:YbjN domain-containing protein [Coleofasciculus sp. E2-BRE-01]|uniref:YbjN domain-containing protein n=1 Tax=Coleofasciculus sp. E2-BRE-01 TaxID=3069524 RepID=UPI0032FFD98A
MMKKTDKYQLNNELTLRNHFQSSLTIYSVSLSLTQQDEEIIECRLTFQVTPELYHRIDTEALFNLKPEVRTPFTNGDFQPSPDIQIEASLKPDLLPLLLEKATNAEEVATYLVNLSQKQPELTSKSTNEKSGTQETDESPDNYQSPYSLLSTESWLALSVKQPQESGETGYRTFWSYLSPQALSKETSDSEEISQAITNFFTDLVGGSLDTVAKDFANETIGSISNFFQELAQDTPEPTPQDTITTQPIFQTMVNFFTEDDWSYAKIQGEPALYLAFEGDNGSWNCYAKAREDEEQFVFYSICPIKVPKAKRRILGEFIARANYGMMIGNFELDFTDGEIRYKTSIDVEGDRLSLALLKRLVYANVTMMDEYLPGIKLVLESGMSPEEAIAQIES